MRDIPFFQTENGVASLILGEVTYKKIAYVRVQSSLQCDALLQECVGFCRAVGADKVYATGIDDSAGYPLYTEIVRMCLSKERMPESKCTLLAVNNKDSEKWRTIYNEKMRNVPNAATMTMQNAASLAVGGAYFVYDNEKLLGIGKISGNRIEALAAVVPGAGRDVLTALSQKITDDFIYVEVATANRSAMKLYHEMQFKLVDELSRWYQIF